MTTYGINHLQYTISGWHSCELNLQRNQCLTLFILKISIHFAEWNGSLKCTIKRPIVNPFHIYQKYSTLCLVYNKFNTLFQSVLSRPLLLLLIWLEIYLSCKDNVFYSYIQIFIELFLFFYFFFIHNYFIIILVLFKVFILF